MSGWGARRFRAGGSARLGPLGEGPVGAALAGLALGLAACGGAQRAAPPPRELLLEAARECERRFVGVEVVGLDHFGQVEFRYREPAHREPFIACWQEQARTKVDAAVAALSSGRLARLSGGPATTSVELRARGGGLLLTARLNDALDSTLLLDTGAGRTLLKPAVVRRLGLTVPRGALRWPFTVADGRVVRVPFVRVSSFRIGELSIADLDVGVYDVLPDAPAVDGVLGSDVLGHFRVEIDRRAGRLTLGTTEGSPDEAPDGVDCDPVPGPATGRAAAGRTPPCVR